MTPRTDDSLSPEPGFNPATRDDIDLFVVELDAWAASRLDESELPNTDRLQAARLRQPGHARRLLARRSATRTILARRLGTDRSRLIISRLCPQCGATDHGKPFVSGTPIAFSVSSSGNLAVIAVAPSAVGVDVEIVGSKTRPESRAMSDREQQSIDSLSGDRRAIGFLRLWTAKEAVLKAAGRSLADDPSTVDVAELLWSESSVVAEGRRRWHVRQIAIPERPEGTVVVALADDRGRPVSERSPWSVGDARSPSALFGRRPPST